MPIAALFVEESGPYANLPGVEVWGVTRDARTYAGPYPVIAHPPCERWGRYWSGGPSAKVRRELGDDNGCFAAALAAVERWGGVLEHPAHSHAYRHFGLDAPVRQGGWLHTRQGYVCHVEQGHYGHRARKATWLYAVNTPLPQLVWGPSQGIRLDEGFHSASERRAARAAGRKPIPRLTQTERIHTPLRFRDLLIGLVNGSQ